MGFAGESVCSFVHGFLPHSDITHVDYLHIHLLTGRCMGVVGNSVCTFVHGFLPYLYIEAPRQIMGPDELSSLQSTLEVQVP